MDNPFKRYEFSKFVIKFCEILMSPSKVWQLYHVMGIQLPIGMLYTDYHKFSSILYNSKAVDQTHSKSMTDSYLPQSNMINKQREYVVYLRIVFLRIDVYITNGELCTHDRVQLPTSEGNIRISQNFMNTLKNHISPMDYPFLSKFWMVIPK